MRPRCYNPRWLKVAFSGGDIAKMGRGYLTKEMKILVTGGAGFIGSSFVRCFMEKRQNPVVTLDSLTYAGNMANLEAVLGLPRHTFVKGDICDPSAVDFAMKGVGAVVHFAAETHVDRSIDDSGIFLRTNVVGTGVLLDAARRHNVKKFVHVSTDEVYGAVLEGYSTEGGHLHPNSPYSASKAASDLLALSYHATYGLPVVVTRCSNNFGPYQFPEKLIPLFISNALEDKPLPVYGDGLYVRDWIYVDDHSRAVDRVLWDGRAGEVYNIGGTKDKANLEITDFILNKLGKPASLKKHVQDRPGHDRRYAMDSSKIEKELGWRAECNFEEALAQTIEWYRSNQGWWRTIKSGEYRNYYEKFFAGRLAGSSAGSVN